MVAPFSGPAKELGRQMKLGIDAAFNAANDAGGIADRRLTLIAADDGYEPARTVEAMKDLRDTKKVFGFVGNVGTPTSAVALPLALERKMLFFGAFTGANLLRHDPPDRYVFNFRASYAEETAAVVRYLIKVRHIRAESIAVFAQQDAFGDAGFAGVTRAVRELRPDIHSTLRLGYQRNTTDVSGAVADLNARSRTTPIKAVVMVATYRAAARFVEKVRDIYPKMIFTNVSFVGSTALAEELKLLGQRYASGVIVTQVVPPVESFSTAILKYKEALNKYFPGEKPDYVSLEGYWVANVLIEGLRRAGRELDSERLVNALESIRDLDLGLGTPLSYGLAEHQASHRVWGTEINDAGVYEVIDLK
jgi:ABC-type branched-subunit amino acid transport system substrate-binding protein